MKTSETKILGWILPVAVLLFLARPVAAQQGIGDLIKAKDDANKLVEAYLKPAGKAVGHTLSSGWFVSGKPLELGRFDIKVFGAVTFGAEEDKTFDINGLGLGSSIRLAPGQSSIAPTAFGDERKGPELIVYGTNPRTNQEEELGRFNTPEGLGYSFAPLPIAQLNIGLIAGTEVAVRFLPEVTHQEYKADMWGVGLKHSLDQWVPALEDVTGFDLMVTGGYTNVKASAGIEVPPAETYRNQPVAQSAVSFANQQLAFETKSLTAGLVAAKTIGTFTVFGGVRYSKVSTALVSVGNYPLVSVRSQTLPPFYQYYIEPVESPLNVKVEDAQYGVNAGFRLKLAIFSIFAEGTYAKYPSAAAGIGLGWY